ncbi:MAG: methyltransferase domain-containing protein [Saprospiraceae bacterium]|nr:methyltransferase domain-containing protein [Saprospiraceae bacterium]
MINNFQFFQQGIRDLKTVGTLVRTAKNVSQKMVAHANVSSANYIVELGAGDGAITKYILEKMKADATLFVFEVNPLFCKKLEQINDERIRIIQASAEDLPIELAKFQIKEVDCIISAIPFVNLPYELAHNIVSVCQNCLKNNGVFVQIHYSMILKKLYKSIFQNNKTDFIPLHVPPVFLFVCKKEN